MYNLAITLPRYLVNINSPIKLPSLKLSYGKIIWNISAFEGVWEECLCTIMFWVLVKFIFRLLKVEPRKVTTMPSKYKSWFPITYTMKFYCFLSQIKCSGNRDFNRQENLINIFFSYFVVKTRRQLKSMFIIFQIPSLPLNWFIWCLCNKN